MKLIIAPGKETEWTTPFLEDPSQSPLGGPIPNSIEREDALQAVFLTGIGGITQMLLDQINQSGLSSLIYEASQIMAQENDPENIFSKSDALFELTSGVDLPPAKTLDSELESFDYRLKMSIVPSPDFYVQPFFKSGHQSSSRGLKQNCKPDLVRLVWQDLPMGYGVAIAHNCFGNQYYFGLRSPSTELVDVEIGGNTREEVLKAVVAFLGSDKYEHTGFINSEDQTLKRQAKFLEYVSDGNSVYLGTRNGISTYGHNNRAVTYQRAFDVSKKTARQEIQELVDVGLVERVHRTPWVVQLPDHSQKAEPVLMH